MKAVRLHQFGGPEVLQLEEVDTPTPGSGEVRIRIVSAGVNPIDWKTREGGGARRFLGDPPIILGWECCGEIEAVCGEQNRWQVGDRVLGLLAFPQAGNCYAEQVIAQADQITPLPTTLDPVAMGGLPLAGLTAWQALFETGKLQSGQRVLVLAAAGGVGHLAVQLAKWKGAWVAGSASSKNHDYLKQLGCDEVIDYQQDGALKALTDIDLVIDAMGGTTGIEALDCLANDGRLVTLPSATADEVKNAAQAKGHEALSIAVTSNATQLQQLVDLVAAGVVQLRVDNIYDLARASEAHQRSQSGHAQGKIILNL